ncbi:hypothetical protein PGB90_000752 [Kerria lacca]
MMSPWRKIYLIYCLCRCVIDIAGLKLTEISIPKHIDLKEKAQLSCKFEITRGKLYSVKWYKDEFEFFRYMPDNIPNIQTFPVEGVNLDVSQSNKTTVTLQQLNFNSSGNYRCEVSKDGPNFETVVRNGDMKVMVFPEDNPIISGIQRSYAIGDYIIGNCTSLPSNPVAELIWYINNRKAESWFLEKYAEISAEGPLYSKSLGIRFQLQKEHFPNNMLELRCAAKIENLPPWERALKIFPDSPLPDGIHAQNRLNNFGK